ncbi:hypothetical protein [Roseisolibacter agri]|uniref:Uncharacterized protein n=1 Tax=Roseisolibacter agri TaxID=2014610 RepID=A0AA37QH51_9BACT|nr:hypothetical protein [Roseisolibacter agri]GLC25688.1 hypothetical protein rosag_22010 [Roseisolibacter agri]
MPVDQQPAVDPSAVPNCPKCQGAMWDNRENKRNPRAPDFKCKDAACGGVIWPPRDPSAPDAGPRPPSGAEGDPACPVCGGRMWDDRQSKRNPRAPDFKCRDKPKYQGGPGCPGVIWPPREGEAPRKAAAPAGGAPAPRPSSPRPAARPSAAPSAPPPMPWRPIDDAELPDDDDLPF